MRSWFFREKLDATKRSLTMTPMYLSLILKQNLMLLPRLLHPFKLNKMKASAKNRESNRKSNLQIFSNLYLLSPLDINRIIILMKMQINQ